jgi:hypothetical protein
MRQPKLFKTLAALLGIGIGVESSQIALSEPATPVKSVRLAAGVIVDPADDKLFVMDPSGTTSAIDVSSGEVEWSTTKTTKPLTVLDGMLVAQAETSNARNVLRIVGLDLKNRGKIRTAQSATLPQGVDAGIEHNAQGVFRAEAQVVGGDVDVSWQFETLQTSGRPYEGSKFRLESSVPTHAHPGAAAPAGKPGGAPNSGTIRFTLSPKAPLPTQLPIVPTSQLMSRFAPVIEEGQSPFLTLSPGEEGYVSADGLAVLQSRQVGDDHEWDRYEWTIVDRGDGQQLANFRTHLRVAPFVIIGSRIVYVDSPFIRQVAPDKLQQSPLSVRAVDAHSGLEVWNRAVRDTLARGPVRP